MAPQFQKSKLPTLLLPVELKACYKLKCAARSSTEEDRVSESETVAGEDNDVKVHRNGSPVQSQRTSAFSGDALSLGIREPVYEVVEVKSNGVVAKRKINRRQLLKSSGLRSRDIRSVDPSLFLTNSVPSILDIRGNDVSLNEYKGKFLLIVNVASKCGLTNSNYKELNILYEKYKNKGFEILAFPCNQFGGQELGTNEEIQETACTLFKAEFPIFDKVDVNGKNSAPLYKFLKTQKGGFLGDAIKWNFTKSLVDKEGKVVERYAPTTSPLKIEKDIQNLL